MQTETLTPNAPAQTLNFEHGQFINGRWRDGSTGRSARNIDPYSGDVLAEFVLADSSDVEDAYKS